jgi:putative phosphoribosyl transferase
MVFANRIEAGRKLAQALESYVSDDVVVFGLARGGVVLAGEVASHLEAPLRLVIPQKIGHPLSPEYAIGAVTETGEPVWAEPHLAMLENTWLDRQIEAARQEAKRRRIEYESDHAAPDVSGRTAILVDDGIATGLSMMAAIIDVRRQHPVRVVAAVPVAPAEAIVELAVFADELTVLYQPLGYFGAISAYYRRFEQTKDEEVRGILNVYNPSDTGEPLDLEALNALVASVTDFPVSAKDMAIRAKRLHAPRSVVSFFESIPSGIGFKDRLDVIRRSEESEMLLEDEANDPDE